MTTFIANLFTHLFSVYRVCLLKIFKYIYKVGVPSPRIRNDEFILPVCTGRFLITYLQSVPLAQM